jgi:predicted acylesterase/phospholipase RssA
MVPADFDAAYGTSSGAINCTLFSYLGPLGLVAQWQTIKSIDDVFQLNDPVDLRPAIYNNSPLLAKATSIVSARKPAIPVTVTVTDLEKFVSIYTQSSAPASVFAKAVADSATIPILVCDPETLNLVDGGVLADLPLERALADGHTDITVMLADPFCESYSAGYGDVDAFDTVLNTLVRLLDKAFHIQNWNAVQKHLGQAKFTIYAPKSETEFGNPLDFSQANINAGLWAGMATKPIVLGSNN